MKRASRTASTRTTSFERWSYGAIALLVSAVFIVEACASDGATSTAVERFPHEFPDAGFVPTPAEYCPTPAESCGPLFELSQDYPSELPGDEELPDFLDLDFSAGEDAAVAYLEAVRDYAFEGNEEIDFRVEHNEQRNWYHMPWQHYGPNGREGIHGLTREAVAQPQQLANIQTADLPANVKTEGQFSTYAIGFYNAFGGYSIGQSWADPNNPQAGNVFPEGTVIFKLLFTEAGEENGVGYLANPTQWPAYVYKHDLTKWKVGTEPADAPREVRQLNLIQMDIMVRDDRTLETSGTGWVFGTFLYNGTVDSSARYRNLIPLGLQWGDDPDLTDPAENFENKFNFPLRAAWDEPNVINNLLQETIINSSSDVPHTHLGWGSRLTGPVDFYQSSCQSCHTTAQWPVESQLSPAFSPDSKEPAFGPSGSAWNRWFQNLPLGEAFDEGAETTDNVLQLQISIKNFYEAKSAQDGGVFLVDGFPNGVNTGQVDPDDLHTRDLGVPIPGGN